MAYSCELINLFIQHVLDGKNLFKIHQMLKISHTTLQRWFVKFKYFIITKTFIPNNYFNNKPTHGLNRIDLYKMQVINFVNTNEGCSLKDILSEIDNKLSNSSVCRILKNNNISHKRYKHHIIGKSMDIIQKERSEFAIHSNQDEYDNSISIDESSFCVDDLKRYGYSKKGKEIKRYLKHKRNKERYTLLLAITKTKIVDYRILEGSVNAETYLNFIKDNISNFKNKRLIQDNARIHHAIIVKDYTIKNNIKMCFNPAYSSEFNPIELAFNKIKTGYRNCDHNDIKSDIKKSINTLTSSDLTNFYDHSYNIINTYKN